ncbi:MAG: twin-arginine translocase subunit TatC [Oligoflexia bacterium]|nr:twin-arginine translocase subunit TatC [Oligoflexia bacterium]
MEKTEKPFWDHIEELRDRIMRSLYALVICSCLGYFIRMPILEFLKTPLFEALPPEKRNLYFTGVFESFFNHLQISILAGVFIGAPFYLYQIWAFIAPGLHEREKKAVVPFIIAGTIFFFLGAAFAYYLVLPVGFKFFIEFGAPMDVPMITVKEYFAVLFRLLLLFGASFELPVILVLLAKVGIVNYSLLSQHRRTAIIGITIASALFAPPDILSMLLMMAPLYVFFEGAVQVIRFMEKK